MKKIQKLEAVDVPIADLELHPHNARQGDVGAIMQSLEAHGQFRPIVVQKSRMRVIAGNHTTQAAQLSGMKTISAVLLDVDDDQALRILLADNQTGDQATNDPSILADLLEGLIHSDFGLEGTGFTGDDLDQLIADFDLEPMAEVKEEQIEVMEPPPNPVTKPGDVWLLGPHRLICGDSQKILKTLPNQSAALVATDPPYFRVVDAEWDDQWGPDAKAFLDWLGGLFVEFDRIMIDRGTVGVFCSPDMSAGVEIEMRKQFAVLNHIVWRKPNPGRLGQMDKSSLRRFFPTSERFIIAEKCRNPDGDLFRFRDHVNHAVARDVYADVREMLVQARDRAGLTNRQVDEALGTSGMAGHYFGASQWTLPTEEAWQTIVALAGDTPMPKWSDLRREFDSRRREFDSRRREFDSQKDASDLELLSDVWTFPTLMGNQRLGHPTQKPDDIMKHIIATMSRKGDTVLDPFLGSGTTLIVAHRMGRICTGVELSPAYCDVICNRFQGMTEITPILEATGEEVSFVDV
jgi:site-specific DNA-methyltransferase (adenine-specific)